MAAAATTPGTVSSVVTHPVEVTDPKDELVQLMAKLDRGEMGLVQVADSIEAALAKRKFVHSLDIAPRMVGMDPINRDGEGGNAQQVLMLAGDMMSGSAGRLRAMRRVSR